MGVLRMIIAHTTTEAPDMTALPGWLATITACTECSTPFEPYTENHPGVVFANLPGAAHLLIPDQAEGDAVLLIGFCLKCRTCDTVGMLHNGLRSMTLRIPEVQIMELSAQVRPKAPPPVAYDA